MDQVLGVTSEQVRELVALIEDPARSCADAREIADTHLSAVRSKMAELRALERDMVRFVERCDTECVGGPGTLLRAPRGTRLSRPGAGACIDTQSSLRHSAAYREEGRVIATGAIYVVAAVAEIAGGVSFWTWHRGGHSAWVLLPGVAALIVFARLLSRVDSAAAGRAYAAYGFEHGFLRDLETVYMWGDISDDPLVPQGRLIRGSAPVAKAEFHIPATRDAVRTWFHELERAAGLEPVKGRARNCLRRLTRDLAPAETSNEVTLNTVSSTSTAMRNGQRGAARVARWAVRRAVGAVGRPSRRGGRPRRRSGRSRRIAERSPRSSVARPAERRRVTHGVAARTGEVVSVSRGASWTPFVDAR